jgi:hypothetical protein
VTLNTAATFVTMIDSDTIFYYVKIATATTATTTFTMGLAAYIIRIVLDSICL